MKQEACGKPLRGIQYIDNPCEIIIIISKLDKIEVLYLQQSNEENLRETKPTPPLKEGKPKRVMLRELTILNPGVSRNQSKILPDMAKIGGGAPIKYGR